MDYSKTAEEFDIIYQRTIARRIIRGLQAWGSTEQHRLFLFPLLCQYENISVEDGLTLIRNHCGGRYAHLYAELSKPYQKTCRGDTTDV